MPRIFDGKLSVHYGQAYIFTNKGHDWEGYLSECFFGQVNGLCGTATPRVIFLITGLHTGSVGLTIDISEKTPPLLYRWEERWEEHWEEHWEEIVEASFSFGEEVDREGIWLYNWDGDRVCQIPLSPGSYRVRYCARNMDYANDVDTLVDEEPIDFYALYFWPCVEEPDAVIKCTSSHASYWHEEAQKWTIQQKRRQQS